MREALSDVVRHVAPHFDTASSATSKNLCKVKITGTEDSTKVEAFTDDKHLFLIAHLKKPIPEFTGEFGISSLSLLKGLLDFPSYKSEEAKFKIHRQEFNDFSYVSQFEFRDRNGAGTFFRTVNPKQVEEQAKIASITWDVEGSPSKAKITEISTLSGLLSEVTKLFTLVVEGGNLYMAIGNPDSSSTHAATIHLMDNVDPKMFAGNNWFYDTPIFLAVLKTAGTTNATVKFCSRGVIGVIVETDHATYTYYLRGKVA